MRRLLIAGAAAVMLALASMASAQVPQRPTSPPVVQPPAPVPNVQTPESAQQPPVPAPLRRLPGATTTQPPSAPTATQPPAPATAVPSGPVPPGTQPTGTLQPPPGEKQKSATAADGLPPPPRGWRLPGDTEGLPMSYSRATASAETPRRPGWRPTRPRTTSYGASPGYPMAGAGSAPSMAIPLTSDPPYPWWGYPPHSWMP